MADSEPACQREVMVSDRMATNESLAPSHAAAFNKSGCVFPQEKSRTISLEDSPVCPKAAPLIGIDSRAKEVTSSLLNTIHAAHTHTHLQLHLLISSFVIMKINILLNVINHLQHL